MALQKIAILSLIIFLSAGSCSLAQEQSASRPQNEKLKAFLTGYVASEGMKPADTYFSDAFVDLNNDGIDEVVVYLGGRGWCGTGGCTTLVLTQKGTSFRLIGRVLATRPPIRALRERKYGWRTLAAWVSGGGIVRGYEAELPFDGRKYPISAAPLQPRALPKGRVGEILIPASAADIRNEKTLSPERGSKR